MTTSLDSKPRPPAWLWLVPSVVAGAVLRTYHLDRQVVGGDELHAVRGALEMPLPEILVTYMLSDHCIPLTAFYRFLMDAGLTLSEVHFRLPILLAGLVFLIGAPWLTARLLGWRVAASFAWLLAISPVLVLYGRIIRSYMPSTVLAIGAAWAFWRFYGTGSRKAGLAYVVLAGLAAYFHLVTAPFVLSPFLFYLYRKVLRRDPEAPSWSAAAALGGAVAAGFLAFMVPARASLLKLIDMKRTGDSPSWSALDKVMVLQSGSDVFALKLVFWLLAIAGLRLLWNRQRKLLGFSLSLVLGQVAGLMILTPLGINQPVIFNRYLIVILPIVLIWVASALAWPWSRATRWPEKLARVSAVVFVALLFLFGPLRRSEFTEGSFAHRSETIRFYKRDPARESVHLPAAYRQLPSSQPGAIVEYPWHTMWRYGRIFPHYQRAHGREVVVSPAEKVLADDRLAFRNMVVPEAEALLASRARYLLVHRDCEAEEAALDGGGRKASRRRSRDLERRRRELHKLNRRSAALAERLAALWGPPDRVDPAARIEVWDLDRVRAVEKRRAP